MQQQLGRSPILLLTLAGLRAHLPLLRQIVVFDMEGLRDFNDPQVMSLSELVALGFEVLGVDGDAERVQTYADRLTHVLQADTTNAMALKQIGAADFKIATADKRGTYFAIGADLAKLVIAAAREPLIEEYSTSERLTVTVGRQLLEYRNTNLLTSKDDWDISVQKTGYTQHAGQCLVMRAMVQDRPTLFVLLNSFGKLTRVADARRVRRWIEGGADGSQLARAARNGHGAAPRRAR